MNLKSYSVTVYLAGDLQTARESLRRQCFSDGLCVTLTPTTFIYTAGTEEGIAVGFVNYPRFPKTSEEIWSRAVEVALRLREELYQRSALVVGPDKTEWFPLDLSNKHRSESMPIGLYNPDPKALLHLSSVILDRTKAKQLTWNVGGENLLVARWMGWVVHLEWKSDFPENYLVTLHKVGGHRPILFESGGELVCQLWHAAVEGRSCAELDALLVEAAKNLEQEQANV